MKSDKRGLFVDMFEKHTFLTGGTLLKNDDFKNTSIKVSKREKNDFVKNVIGLPINMN